MNADRCTSCIRNWPVRTSVKDLALGFATATLHRSNDVAIGLPDSDRVHRLEDDLESCVRVPGSGVEDIGVGSPDSVLVPELLDNIYYQAKPSKLTSRWGEWRSTWLSPMLNW